MYDTMKASCGVLGYSADGVRMSLDAHGEIWDSRRLSTVLCCLTK